VVRKFPRAHPPLRVDGMVGQHTLDELDSLLLRPKPPPAPRPLEIIPFHETSPILISSQSHSLSKSDLEDTPSAPSLPATAAGFLAKQLLSRARKSSTLVLEDDMRRELLLGGGIAGKEILDTFVANSIPKATITFGIGSSIAKLVQASRAFKTRMRR
jgi:hypothetical protein